MYLVKASGGGTREESSPPSNYEIPSNEVQSVNGRLSVRAMV